MAEKHPFLIFFDSFQHFCKANKNCDYLVNFQNACNFLFYMGSHYVEFTFAFDTTLIRLEMTELWPKYFCPPPRNYQLRGPPGIGLRISRGKEVQYKLKAQQKSRKV